MYGFADHGVLTPHSTIKQLWWTEERIEDTVNRRLVVRHIRGKECEFLDKPIIYEAISNDTYLEWILYRSPRLFLILIHVGCPDRIFSLIDDGWQDEDLPILRNDVRKLDLSIETDEVLNRNFYITQFRFLLRQLEADDHIQYGPNEYVPMEYVCSIPTAVTIQPWPRVHFPDDWDSFFVRRHFELSGNEEKPEEEIQFLHDVKEARKYKHEHIADVWASYTSEDGGFTLTTFIGEHTLRTFMDHRTPPQYTDLTEAERPCLLLEWMHCLADTVAYLHHNNTHHGSIRPSNILIDDVNNIAFSDLGRLKTFEQDQKVSKQELHDYTAPELLADQGPPKPSIYNPFGQHETSWKISITNLTQKANASPPATRTNSVNTVTAVSPIKSSPPSLRNFSRHLTPPRKDSAHETDSVNSPSSPSRPTFSLFPNIPPPATIISSAPASAASTRPTSPVPLPTPPMSPLSATFSHTSDPTSPLSRTTTTMTAPVPTQFTPQAADIFSLGLIYLDILTFLVLGKTTTFNKFRKSKSSSIPTTTGTTPSVFSATDTASLSATSTTSTLRRSKPHPHFASDPARVAAWTEHLIEESLRHDAPTHSAVVELLKLTKQMLAPTPGLRPTAQEVRDVVELILLREAGMECLCCGGRKWNEPGEEGGAAQGLVDRLYELEEPERAEQFRKEERRENQGIWTEWLEEKRGGFRKGPMARGKGKGRAKGKRVERRGGEGGEGKLEELRSHFSDEGREKGIRIAGLTIPFRNPWRGPVVKMP
ncbi:Calcium/calmodulin-dependent protein kinase [Elsinoe australis]|uniref:Calcium/calmodulin-dependent protein kinase n=1 Tax=Elsinoe australis TaxID=40998 RepID=A0A2P8A2Z1_9PEZI|nr:Calcium/calmodulin-dependent protein kinase [Elsinoe australis]